MKKGCEFAQRCEGGYKCPVSGIKKRKGEIPFCGDYQRQQGCSETQNKEISDSVWNIPFNRAVKIPLADGVYSSQSGARSSRR